ncbi:acetyl-CoA carboxylase biotin carboxyl carrier protein [Meiothermus ruber]|jgi:acetyl-CoA carboxylase biotin carboxyl carrier protein|uniref:Biotin carboxyl carrier protein of acetyl-CoA carboxylase n=1 Tax=Meiothermus ruber (strain ATCC 35948 / DSM 1279 / VKM B-1258 / 21) TaxID=504728 RepID=A0A806DIS8_MEIRD|nr:acetyl-CoA carboxylase biotin carboxyl carrier protein [Meiothermus ruber]ADD28305.1 acetyl-CoA carboxylase, biotin carboxyl carrier protein [Meiothermus ruber DSM 1279]MCL6529091.1 acetyl-CoA carboxylase biotin carboxyl carrier protein [Meiothermus ruber]GAO75259.1 acetyl-CoA carboxylase biotin carboxyl carrier protein [Meiothermus ruber H328]GIW39043.1 MAG: acetyl-CoA carboxylase biotin carboxyl carrier protein subunit [Meiothermus sp.]
MNAKELKSILQALQEHEVAELTLETPDYKLTVKRGGEVQYVAAPAPVVIQPQAVPASSPSPVQTQAETPAPAPTPKPEVPKEDTSRYVEVKAPIVGTFYRAPSPEAEPFVKEGDLVKKGQVLCIIEAMKLMNEIESEVSGVVRKILVSNGEPIEYGQVLFLIEPA